MTPAERKLRKQQRAKLLYVQSDLTRIHCKYCPVKNDAEDPDIKCGGCAIYDQLRDIGKQLQGAKVLKKRKGTYGQNKGNRVFREKDKRGY